MDFEPDAIPEQQRQLAQWICWAIEVRQDKDNLPTETKVPRDPRSGAPGADPTDPDTWADFETAVATAEAHDLGIGFCFNAEGLLAGVDLDDCRDPETGEIDEWAQEIIDRLNSYTVVSTSGTGVHVYALGFVPDGGNRKGDVEMYSKERFFAVTGDHLEGTPETIEQRSETLREIHAEFIADDTDDDQQTLADVDAEPADLSLEELLAKAKNAKNGDKFERLWDGDTSGYDSHSEADLALCNLLAFWTAGDTARMDALFRRSGLMREKWDEDRGGQTYGELTISTAVGTVSDYYQPPAHEPLEGVEPVDDPDPTPTEEQLAEMLDEDDDDRDQDRTNGGAAASDGASTTGGGGIASWPGIRATYKLAHEPGEPAAKHRQQARYVAARRLEEVEEHFATNEVAEKLYVYDPALGIYTERGKAHVHERLVDELRDQFTNAELNEIVAQIKGRTFRHPDEFGGPDGYINVKNGILEVGRGGVEQLIDHTPDHLFLARVETAYDPDAKCPRWEEFLGTSAPREEDRKTLQEFAGYTLMNWAMPYAKALFLVGPTASGKSTFMDVWRDILGDEAVSSVAPQQFGENRFAAYDLWESWANMRGDIDEDVVHNIGLFKEMTSGDPIRVEDKNQPAFDIRPTAKHLYAANQVPDISTDDDAFYRRIVLATFPVSVPPHERKPKELFQAELLEERAGILNWAIEGLNRLMQQNGFTGDLSPSATRERWEEWGDSIAQFKAECLVKETGAIVPKKTAYNAYAAFCEGVRPCQKGTASGLPQEGQRKLTIELKKDKDIDDAERTPEPGGKQVRVYTGVRLADEWEQYGGGGDVDADDDDNDDPPDSSLDSFSD